MEEDEQLRSHVLRSMVKDSSEIGGPSEHQNSPCVICLEDISEHARTAPCAHEFDFVCIVNWLERNPTCPLCKSRVLTVDYGGASWQDFKVYTVQHPHPLPAADAVQSQSLNRDEHHQQQPGQQTQQRQTPQRHMSRSSVFHEDPLVFRKHIYSHQLYSLHIGSNRFSRFQELTPKRFAQDTEIVSRARKWIRRELRVFEFLTHSDQANIPRGGIPRHVGNAEFLLEWIIAMLKSVNIKGSNGQAEDMLQEFLGRDNTRLFLHELRAWLRSPYSELHEWDCQVQYDEMSESLQSAVSTVQRRGTDRRRGRDGNHYAPYPSSRPVRERTG